MRLKSKPKVWTDPYQLLEAKIEETKRKSQGAYTVSFVYMNIPRLNHVVIGRSKWRHER